MPKHSSKNFHEFEHECLDKELQWKQTHECILNPETHTCNMCDLDTHPFDTSWSYRVKTGFGRKELQHTPMSCYQKRYELYYKLWCSCPLCIEFVDSKEVDLVQKYFSAQEILDTNAELKRQHLQNYEKSGLTIDCDCCMRGRWLYWYSSASCQYNSKEWFYETYLKIPDSQLFLKSELYAHVLSRNHDTTPFTPKRVNMEYVMPCTLNTLLERYKETLLDIHKHKERREKAELFARYGLSLSEYEARKN